MTQTDTPAAARHTPGPWAVTGQSEGGRYITVKGATGRTVARVPFNTEAEVEADKITDADDALLIAAAPDMLAALKALVEHYTSLVNSGDCGHWDSEAEASVIAARAAIAKAEGRA